MTELKSTNGVFFKYIIDFTPFQIKTLKFYVKIISILILVTHLDLIMLNQKTKKKL